MWVEPDMGDDSTPGHGGLETLTCVGILEKTQSSCNFPRFRDESLESKERRHGASVGTVTADEGTAVGRLGDS